MKSTKTFKTFGAAVSLVALSAFGTSTVTAAPIISGNGIDGYFDGYDCIADSCVNLANAGYDVSGGGVVNPSANASGLYLIPGSNSSNPDNTLSYNVTSRESQTDPAGSGTPITVSNLDGAIDFYWGSVDAYNVVEFFSGTDSVWEITGTTLANALGRSTTSNYHFDAYVSFVGGFDRVVFSSTGGAAFEIAAAVPEPGALSLLGLGLIGLGFARRLSSAKR